MDITIQDILEMRQEGKEIADLEESVNARPRQYLLIAYEVFSNGTTSGTPVLDQEIAKEIGRATRLGDPTDVAGFGIWSVDAIRERRSTGEEFTKHEYVPRNPDKGDWACERCGFGRHHPWHS